jgi:plasmid replication initiation protein
MEKPLLSIRQPNLITQARYEYTRTEKRIVYFIIKQVQQYMETGIAQETIFNDLVFQLPIGQLLEKPDSKNHKEIRKAAKSLRNKDFEIIDPDDPEEGDWAIFGFINYAQYFKKKQILEVQVSKLIMPFLFELAKGFTAYSLTVAISLKSVYSQRFYEFCNQWKDTGKWYISLQELKEILKLEEHYELYGDFKRKVLEVARKELKERVEDGTCDVWFDFKEKKNGRKIEDLVFTIYWKDKQARKPQTNEEMQYVANLLKSIFPEEKQKPYVANVLNELHRKNQLGLITKRLQELEDQALIERKPLNAYGGLLRHILQQDYKIN